MEQQSQERNPALQAYRDVLAQQIRAQKGITQPDSGIQDSFYALMSPESSISQLEDIYWEHFKLKSDKKVKIYAGLLDITDFDAVRPKILNGWLVNSILQHIQFDLRQNHNRGVLNQILLSLESLNFEGNIQTFLREFVLQILNKLARSNTDLQRTTTNIINRVSASKGYQVFRQYFTNRQHQNVSDQQQRHPNSIKEEYQPMQAEQQRVENQGRFTDEELRRIANSMEKKEEEISLKEDLKKYSLNSLEYAVQDALQKAFQLKYCKNRDPFGPVLDRLLKAYDAEKQYINHNRTEIELQIAEIIREGDVTEYYDKLKRLKKLLLIIDVAELERLIKKTAHSKEMIKGKNIILVVGTTGSGKTTTILRILGYQLKEVDFHGFKIYEPKHRPAPNHESFLASPETKSCTRYINAAQIGSDMHQLINRGDFQDNLYICDSPGFGDTGGSQIDISNQIGLINALSECNSVRILLILAHDAVCGEKMKGAKEIAQIMNRLCCGRQTITRSTHVFFNKLPSKQQINHVQYQISDGIKNRNQIGLTNKVVTFFRRLQQLSEDQNNYTFPISEQKIVWQKRLRSLDILKPIQKSGISKQLQYTFSEKSKADINAFLNEKIFRIRMFLGNNLQNRVLLEYESLSLLIRQFQPQNNEEESMAVFEFSSHQSTYQQISADNPYKSKVVEAEQVIKQKSKQVLSALDASIRQIIHGREYYEEVDRLRAQLAGPWENLELKIKDVKTKKDGDQLVISHWERIKAQLLNTDSRHVLKKTQIVVRYSLKFGLQQKLNELKREKQGEFQALERYKNSNLEAYDERINQSINKMIVLANILKVIQSNHWSWNVVEGLKTQILQNISRSQESIRHYLSAKIQQRLIKLVDQYLVKSDKVLKLTIFERNMDLRDKRNNLIKDMEKICADRIHSITTSSIESSYQVSHQALAKMAGIRQEIQELLKLDFLKDKFRSTYQETCTELINNFSQNLAAVRADIASNICESVDVNYYNYFQQRIKSIINIIKHSSIINQPSEHQKTIEELVRFIQEVIQKSLPVLNTPENLHELNIKAIKLFFSKTNTHCRIFTKYKKNFKDFFEPLENANRSILLTKGLRVRPKFSQHSKLYAFDRLQSRYICQLQLIFSISYSRVGKKLFEKTIIKKEVFQQKRSYVL